MKGCPSSYDSCNGWTSSKTISINKLDYYYRTMYYIDMNKIFTRGTSKCHM